MNVAADRADVAVFRDLVVRKLGLQFEESKQGQLAEVLGRRLESRREPPAVYLGRLEASGHADEELRALARELTVSETYFFRNMDQLRAFADVAVPDRMRVQAEHRRLRLLSAGCASGEEPFSLAMLMSERLTDPSWTVSIRAVDINPGALEKAARARYSAWALRETPSGAAQRWFRPAGKDFELDEAIRRAVTFEERNLSTPDHDLWRSESYDVVFCRNVLMYFTKERAAELVARIQGALAPGGYLFLGHAETLRGLSNDFHLKHTHGAFYYERRSTLTTSVHPSVSTVDRPADVGAITRAVGEAATWIDAIQRASDRIQALAQGSTRRPEPVSETGAGRLASAPSNLGWAIELLKAERFGEALDLVHALPPDAASDPDTLLLRATLLTHAGRLSEAQRSCEDLLERDELNAGAHYLLALCREGQTDLQGASEHDEIAAYLDPMFAMPRLHMGLLARRAGNRDVARRELSQALELLHGEEASRVLLFGGGFSRDALAALCRAELVACGGAA